MTTSPSSERLLTVAEAAELLRVPRSWVYKRVQAGGIPYIKIGRYVRFEEGRLRGWIAEQARA